jgi:hypothetical protein
MSGIKVLAIIVVSYLATGMGGVFDALSWSGVIRFSAVLYLGCFLLSIAGIITAFTSRLRAFRIVSLWAIGLPCLFYATQDVCVGFPAFLTFKLVLGSSYSSGEFTKLGVDVIPSVLFVVLWVVTKRAVLRQENQASGSGQ